MIYRDTSTAFFAIATALLLSPFASLAAENKPAPAPAIEIGAPFADHAVLQRQQPIPVWGWSKPGTEVTVTFAGQFLSAKAAENGKWTVTLAPLEASAEGRDLTISEKSGASRTLKDILVGEVWMASGQSNIQWIASKGSVQNLIDPLKAKDEHQAIKIKDWKAPEGYKSVINKVAE